MSKTTKLAGIRKYSETDINFLLTSSDGEKKAHEIKTSAPNFNA